ncbi:MAG TPA: phosphatase PAP2 family protein, partial [Thermoanaerobaculia bacterium]|nr:phosphatase PAP2 family protein [Thermoanaerobaculia bacterium]
MKRLYFFEPFIAVNFLLIQALLWHITRTPLRSFFKDFAVLVPAFLVQALVGIAVRAAIQRRAYGIAIRSKAWLADTARLILFSVLSVQTYCWIKLAVPLLHHGLFDEQLRDISRALFFGHSPNILLIDLFANPVAMRAVDWSYANVFIASINIASVYFISDPDRRIRVGFMNSNTLMWITGAWLYVLVPSLGPAYVFPRFYLSLAPHLPETQELQRILMYNYQNVLHNGPVNLFYGIAAFPSLHVAFEFLVWLWLRRVWRPGAIAFAIFTVVIFIGSIVTGWHYLIDSLA